MEEIWKFTWFRDRLGAIGLVLLCLLCPNFSLCWSLNNEGLALLKFREKVVNDPFGALLNWNDEDGEVEPCSWFGVECSDGKVVALNLKDLCLEGTLAPDIKNLAHIKSIILRNNSFTGNIPVGIGELKELEVLDLGYNNFCRPLPADLGSNLSLGILLLDNNRLLGRLSPEIYELQLLSESQVDENQLANAAKISSCNKRSLSWHTPLTEGATRRQLKAASIDLRKLLFPPDLEIAPSSMEAPSPSPFSPSASPSPSPGSPIPEPVSPSPSPQSEPPSPASESASPEQGQNQTPSTGSDSVPPPSQQSAPLVKKSSTNVVILVGSIAGSIFLLICAVGVYLCVSNKATVRPWATGLSGQLQKAFVTGVPKLKRSELETACEDFSNVIGFSPFGTVYKGTLSSGVEIAVASVAVKSAKDWSNSLEIQFRTKIDSLSKVNHKNFVNLLGHCEEEQPFTRLMVFEYAPNGTLFEHLHIIEAEHLDWRMRLRIAAGLAYCLEHMHQLNPPIAHNNLTSSAVTLTEDYAAKLAEFSIWNETAAAKRESAGSNLEISIPGTPESNVYSFGVLLFEMMTGRLPYCVDDASGEDWASDYLGRGKPLEEIVDPTLKSFEEEKLEPIGEVLKSCTNPDPIQRPTMREVSARLRSITGISPDEAIPKLSPLWWAEIEILSSETR